MKHLLPLGFHAFFQKHVDATKLAMYQIARVCAVDKESYRIINGDGEVRAEITGKLMFRCESPLDYPTVGDWVYARYADDDFALIEELLPRKSLMKRKTSGKKTAHQLVAANVDTAFVMQSLDQNFNLRRLERYLVMANESGVYPVVLLSKQDLLSPEEVARRLDRIAENMPNLQVIPFSNLNPSSVDSVMACLEAEKTYCLLGSSGVGKTSLLNNLLGRAVFKTVTIREKDHKGRHATTRRQLMMLDNGAMLIDTPGMRELAHIDAETGLSDTFDEFNQLAAQCRFADCTHTQETGCAILAALDEGAVATDRYHSYIKMTKEAAHYRMSYIEKRRKDKQFGKMVKSVMKSKRLNDGNT